MEVRAATAQQAASKLFFLKFILGHSPVYCKTGSALDLDRCPDYCGRGQALERNRKVPSRIKEATHGSTRSNYATRCKRAPNHFPRKTKYRFRYE